MTQYANRKLLTPPREEEEIYPYRRAWRSLVLEVGALFGLTLVLYVALGIIGINIPQGLWTPFNVALAFSPLIFWLFFSLIPEYRVPEPRRRLLAIAIISGLTANAVALPILAWSNPNEWLSLAGTFDRILGYGFSIGIVQVSVMYVVVRFITWPDFFRIRNDAIAFTTSAAVSYITVANLSLVLTESLSPDVAVLRIFSSTTLQILAAVVLAYGFAELRFNPKTYVAMPLSVLFGAILIGFGITFRSGFVSGGFTLGIGTTRPLFGFGFSVGLIGAGLLGMLFLFNVAERRAREAQESGND